MIQHPWNGSFVGSWWNFDQRQSKKTLWKLLQNFQIWLKWNAKKIYGFCPFWYPIYFCILGPKHISKTKISAKTTSLGKSNKSRSQKNDKVLIKLSKKKLGVQIGSKLPPWSWAKESSEILTYYIIGTSIYTFWMPRYGYWVFAILNFTQKKQLLSWFMTSLDPFL